MTKVAPPHRHHFPWVRIVAIVAVMTVLVSALWLAIRQVDDTDVGNPDPTTAPAPASPEATPPGTPGASPPAEAIREGDDGPAWRSGSLPDLLTYAPDRLADDSLPLNDVARYADIAAWMTAHGLAAPASLADAGLSRWEAELDNLALPPSLRERGLDPVWQGTYGFDLTQIEQVLIIGQAPDHVMILKGAFDPDALQAAWVASGYQAIEVEGTTVWSLFPGDTIDLSAQESRPAMGTLNNVVLLEDGTLVAAAKTSRLGATLEVVNGNAPSLAENDDLAALLLPGTGVERLASAVISKGSLLQATSAMLPPPATPASLPGPVATPGIDAGMPEVSIVLLGIPLPPGDMDTTPVTGPDTAQPLTMLLVPDDEAEAQAAATEIRARLGGGRSSVTGEPYAARIAAPEVGVLESDDGAVVRVTGTLAHGAGDWLEIISDRDLGFAFWLPEE